MLSTLFPCRPAVASQRFERFAQHARLDHYFQECLPLKSAILEERIRVLFAKAERIRLHLAGRTR